MAETLCSWGGMKLCMGGEMNVCKFLGHCNQPVDLLGHEIQILNRRQSNGTQR